MLFTRLPSRLSALGAATLLALFIGACGGSEPGAPVISSVSVTPATTTLVSIGATAQLSASVRDEGGSPISGATTTWASSSAAVATVNATGLVTAVSNGTATITVTSGGASGTATVTVNQQAATITVAPSVDTIVAGSSLTLTATATDAGGTVIASPSFTWSSSDAAVAAVSAAGVVQAQKAGSATITAAADGASGTASILVFNGNLNVANDTTLSGTMEADSVTIATGTTVTLADDFVLTASGPVRIAGNVAGTCRAMNIQTTDSLVVTGNVSLACAAPTTDSLTGRLTLTATGGMRIQGAAIVASGRILIRDDPTVNDTSDVSFPTAALRASGAGAAAGEAIQIIESSVSVMPAKAENGNADDRNGDSGWGVGVLAKTGNVVLNASTLVAQDGGDGADHVLTGLNPEATGGRGGGGGSAYAMAQSGNFALIGNSTLTAGRGGNAGKGRAVGADGPGEKASSATATGGRGGSGGYVWINALTTAGGSATVYGRGPGRGGDAEAIAADGRNATQAEAAQAGGDATAEAGDRGEPALLLTASDLSGLDVPPGEVNTSDDGDAVTHAGNGGAGIALLFPNGANGGNAEVTEGTNIQVTGGNGGAGAGSCPAPTSFQLLALLSVLSDPGNSDQFIFNAGGGNVALALILALASGGPGGIGGNGGAVSLFLGLTDNATITNAMNGGMGGIGTPGGAGGQAGTVPASANNVTVTGSGAAGATGQTCSSITLPAAGPSVTYNAETSSITFSSAAPFITVSGTLNDDNTFTASGRGTMAGVPNILVTFTGTYDPETGALSGDYSMDNEKTISAGHPLIYRIQKSN